MQKQSFRGSNTQHMMTIIHSYSSRRHTAPKLPSPPLSPSFPRMHWCLSRLSCAIKSGGGGKSAAVQQGHCSDTHRIQRHTLVDRAATLQRSVQRTDSHTMAAVQRNKKHRKRGLGDNCAAGTQRGACEGIVGRAA